MSKRGDDAKLVAADADRYAAIYAVSTSEGGKILIESLKQDVIAAVDKLCNGYTTMSEIELRATCATLSVNRSLIQSLTRSKDNLDGASDALDELME